jgi:hypothetical protein
VEEMEDEVMHRMQPHTLSFHKNLVLCDLSDLKLDAKDQVVPCSFMPAKSLEIHKTG